MINMKLMELMDYIILAIDLMYLLIVGIEYIKHQSMVTFICLLLFAFFKVNLYFYANKRLNKLLIDLDTNK